MSDGKDYATLEAFESDEWYEVVVSNLTIVGEVDVSPDARTRITFRRCTFTREEDDG